MKRIFILMSVAGALAGLPDARGQSIGPSTLNATGGSAIIGGNEYEWSIGEMTMVSTFTSSTVIVTQGLLQNPLHTTEVNTLMAAENVQVFPNPASTLLNVQYTAQAAGTLSYTLLDMAGKIVARQAADVGPGTTKKELNIAPLAAAAYLLDVTFSVPGAAAQSASFKIQKLK